MKEILEGLLFVSGEDGLTLSQIIDILGISEDEAKNLIIDLKHDYEDNNRGIRIHYLGNTFKLTTKSEHKDYYQKLLTSADSNTLSSQALEVLAIIVYNEPITKLKIDELRGVNSAQIVRKLVAKELVKEVGRDNTIPGRPILYKTTSTFLDYFGLSSKDDLPKLSIDEVLTLETDLFDSKYTE